jgi:hypothetical protein
MQQQTALTDRTVAMLRYTARNGTTFHFDPAAGDCVQVISPDVEDALVDVAFPVDIEDLREFMQHLDDLADDIETDADCSAVGPD